MNQREHKAEAERLVVLTKQTLEGLKSNGAMSHVPSLTAVLNTAQVFAVTAQVHATLATIPDPIDSAAQAKLGPL